jgi:hypothetical protein
MRQILATMATTHVDRHGDKMTLDALQGMAQQIEQHYLPITLEHDIRHPPVGRVVSGKVTRLSDGEYALEATIEVFEEDDSLESLAGDGRQLRVRPENIHTIAVGYDRTFCDEEGQQLLADLSEISAEGQKPTEIAKKSLEPIATLVIISGISVVGGIARGFFSKLGADLYEKLKQSLGRYYRKKPPREHILDFLFFATHDESALEVHVLVAHPSQEEIDELLSGTLDGIDALVLSLPIREAGIAKVVLEYSNRRMQVRYAVRRDCVPLTLPQTASDESCNM